jgi:hypothetical protein
MLLDGFVFQIAASASDTGRGAGRSRETSSIVRLN